MKHWLLHGVFILFLMGGALGSASPRKVFETVFRTDGKGSILNEADGSAGRLSKQAAVCDTVLGKGLSLPGDIYSCLAFPVGGDWSQLKEGTLGMWVYYDEKPDAKAPGNRRAYGMFSIGWLLRGTLTPDLRCMIQATGKDASGKDCYFSTSADFRDMVPGTWNHVAVSYSVSASKMILMLNGREMAMVRKDVYKKTALQPIDFGNNFLRLGSLPNYSPFRGILGRTRIYSQVLDGGQLQTEENDLSRLILQQCAKSAPELAGEISGLLSRPAVPLAEVNRIQRRVMAVKADRKNLKDSAAPFYYSVVDPMGLEIFLPDSAMPEKTVNGPLKIVAARGEYEPASFLLRPLRDIPKFLPVMSRLETRDGKTLPPSAVDIRLVKVLVQSGGGAKNRHIRTLKPTVLLHDDELVIVDTDKMENYLRLSFPGSEIYQWISKWDDSFRFEEYRSARENPIYDARTIRPMKLRKNYNQQFWLTVHVPETASPGLYRGTLKLTAAGKELGEVPVRLRVLPFKLPEPKTNYDLNRPMYPGVYYRHNQHNLFDKNAPGSITSRGRNEQQFRAELRNLKAHGVVYPSVVMSFNMPGWRWNTWGTDKDGGRLFEPTQKDKDYFRRCMEILREEGLKTRPLFIHTGGNFGFRCYYDRKRDFAALKKCVESTHQIVQEVLGHQDVQFYGVDEAHGKELLAEFEIWEDMKKLGAKVYTTAVRTNTHLIAGRISTLIAARPPGRRFAKDMHDKGGIIWNYANPQAGQKERPYPYRVNYGFGVYTANYDGFATYGWNVSAAHPWNDFDNRVEPDLAFVIGTADGVVDTPSWEGYREGIDDIRYATLLRQEMARAMAGDKADKKATAEAAGKWLEKINVDSQGFDPQWVRLQIIEWILKLI